MKKLLLVVDYQKDFVDGALGFSGAEALDKRIADKISAGRSAGVDIAFTMDTHGSDYRDTQEGQKIPIPHCLAGSEGWNLYGAVGRARRDEDRLISKPAFPSLALGEWLEDQVYDQVELVGLVSYMCVLSNAIMVKAALPEAEVLVDASCTAGPDPTLHEKALDLMEALQITVLNR